jgi:hypothetical protein
VSSRRIISSCKPGQKLDPISKITRKKRAGGMVQIVEHMPNKHKSPEFKPQYCKQTKKTQTKSLK